MKRAPSGALFGYIANIRGRKTTTPILPALGLALPGTPVAATTTGAPTARPSTTGPATTTAAATTTAPSTPSAASAFWLGPCLIDPERLALELAPVKAVDGSLSFVVVFHLYKSEPSRLTAELVRDYPGRGDLPVSLKSLSQLVLRYAVRQTADIDIHFLLLFNVNRQAGL